MVLWFEIELTQPKGAKMKKAQKVHYQTMVLYHG